MAFPSSPATDDTYQIGTQLWTYNGSAWVKNTSGSSAGVDLSNYYNKGEVDALIANFITETAIDSKIASAVSGGSVDLSNYVTQSELTTAIANAGGSGSDLYSFGYTQTTQENWNPGSIENGTYYSPNFTIPTGAKAVTIYHQTSIHGNRGDYAVSYNITATSTGTTLFTPNFLTSSDSSGNENDTTGRAFFHIDLQTGAVTQEYGQRIRVSGNNDQLSDRMPFSVLSVGTANNSVTAISAQLTLTGTDGSGQVPQTIQAYWIF